MVKGSVARWATPFLAAAMIVGAVGCTGLTIDQQAAVKEFSVASTALGKTISTELVQMRNATIQMNEQRLKLGKPEKGEPGPDDLDENFDVEPVLARVYAAKVLQAYGEILQSLVDDTQEKELNDAADAFMASVRGLPKANQKLNDDQLEALGTIVQTIGGWVVEAKKAKAVRAVVEQTKGQIDLLCDLLSQEFNKDRDGKLASQFVLTTERLLVAADAARESSRGPEERAQALAAFKLAGGNRARYGPIHKEASGAAVKMKRANDELVTAMKSGRVSMQDVREFRNSVMTVVNAVNVLK